MSVFLSPIGLFLVTGPFYRETWCMMIIIAGLLFFPVYLFFSLLPISSLIVLSQSLRIAYIGVNSSQPKLTNDDIVRSAKILVFFFCRKEKEKAMKKKYNKIKG